MGMDAFPATPQGVARALWSAARLAVAEPAPRLLTLARRL